MKNIFKKSFMSSLVNFSTEIVLKIGSVVKRKFAYFAAIKTVCLPWKHLISSVRSKICKHFSMKHFRLPSFYFSIFFFFFVIYDSIVIRFNIMKKSKDNVQFIIIREVDGNERKRVVRRQNFKNIKRTETDGRTEYIFYSSSSLIWLAERRKSATWKGQSLCGPTTVADLLR